MDKMKWLDTYDKIIDKKECKHNGGIKPVYEILYGKQVDYVCKLCGKSMMFLAER